MTGNGKVYFVRILMLHVLDVVTGAKRPSKKASGLVNATSWRRSTALAPGALRAAVSGARIAGSCAAREMRGRSKIEIQLHQSPLPDGCRKLPRYFFLKTETDL